MSGQGLFEDEPETGAAAGITLPAPVTDARSPGQHSRAGVLGAPLVEGRRHRAEGRVVEARPPAGHRDHIKTDRATGVVNVGSSQLKFLRQK